MSKYSTRHPCCWGFSIILVVFAFILQVLCMFGGGLYIPPFQAIAWVTTSSSSIGVYGGCPSSGATPSQAGPANGPYEWQFVPVNFPQQPLPEPLGGGFFTLNPQWTVLQTRCIDVAQILYITRGNIDDSQAFFARAGISGTLTARDHIILSSLNIAVFFMFVITFFQGGPSRNMWIWITLLATIATFIVSYLAFGADVSDLALAGDSSATFGYAFWLTLLELLLLLIAALSACWGGRKRLGASLGLPGPYI
ncbi:uncharacterized protein BJ171DRAFT_578035 [Polychytrium aggregatum]|uniref:uncharacterized protein n=1 Tax=Polychytrium aggregatum TaxID=110093 RepID=UPI0022FDE8D5|nr:uncharacterized protein BJ171DRAFT_578035 [Polychytrium aggregatum]KAI9208223.1 hypothetical protein BJ171DRAFT_578035 [Polychytrium aggregatum]